MSKFREYTPNDYSSYKQVHHKNFRDGTKYKVVQAIAQAGKKGITRTDLMKVIWENQGYDPKKFVYRPGNCSQLFGDIQSQGLAKSDGKGTYTITEGGEFYLKCTTRREAGTVLHYLRCDRYYRASEQRDYRTKRIAMNNNKLHHALRRISEITKNVLDETYPSKDGRIEILKQKIGMLGWDYDRMSSSGQQTLDEIDALIERL